MFVVLFVGHRIVVAFKPVPCPEGVFPTTAAASLSSAPPPLRGRRRASVRARRKCSGYIFLFEADGISDDVQYSNNDSFVAI